MKVSYNWLKNYIKTDESAEKIAELLTASGLEIGGIEQFNSVEGGLEGLVVGQVLTCKQHPNADRLSLTTVDVGNGSELQIACGASNVAEGQKVVVAKPGTTIYPIEGDSFTIKQTKIRGELSQGMICAEDEIGLGFEHDGIMVLEKETKTGTLASEYFQIEKDTVLEIDLTPNRVDGASHYGVARDLYAVLKNSEFTTPNLALKMPDVSEFKVDNNSLNIEVVVEDHEACPRYAGICISDVKIKPSPDWLQNRLKAIGLSPINNVVDATNFVLHELGQPLHAFDLYQVNGDKILVKKLEDKTKFVTLDEVERKLSNEDLMICNAESGMCIAGVFGGIKSGVTDLTKNIFLESAYFDPVHVRKTAKRHGLNTDASFRFERGADPEMTITALKRAALLIKEIAGGKISSDIIDIYPKKLDGFTVDFSFENCNRLIGKSIAKSTIKSILNSLEIEVKSENDLGLTLHVPAYRVDVQREVDVIEEVLRIYGYNNIELPSTARSALAFSPKPNKEKFQNAISDLLVSNGFNEIMSNSLTNSAYYDKEKELSEKANVHVLNPISEDLDILRQTLLFGGLEAIQRNQNRQNPDIKFFEFGKTYEKKNEGYEEREFLALFLTGKREKENWSTKDKNTGFYDLKGYVEAVLLRTGCDISACDAVNGVFQYGISYKNGMKPLVEFGKVKQSITHKFDLKNDLFYASFCWVGMLNSVKSDITFKQLSKFPSVRRDLALLLDKKVEFSTIEQMARKQEKKLLQKVNLFDVYEGEGVAAGKKSYAVSFTFLDHEKTLTDKVIDKVMKKLVKTYQDQLGAELR